MTRLIGKCALAAASLLILLGADRLGSVKELGRKRFLGVQISSQPGQGVTVSRVFPEGSAKEAGVEDGDVVVSIEGQKVATAQDFVKVASTRGAGASLKLEVLRGTETKVFDIALREAPRERSDDLLIEYGSIESKGNLLRTIVTRPKGEGKYPAVLIIQGLMCVPVESSVGPPSPYRRICEDLARDGIVAMRVEKPGCGDSQGGPCSEVDFLSELDGYRQALKALRASPAVDSSNVHIFGHSMGGIMSPLLAGESKVRGSAVYGTVAKPWDAYMMENSRRQLLLSGDLAKDELKRRLELQERFLKEHLKDKKDPKAIAETDPEMRGYVSETYPDGVHQFGRHHRFFQQLADVDPAVAWKNASGDVLAIWGKADFVSSEDDHKRIAEIVNSVRPGRGKFLALDESDHGFAKHATQESSFDAGLQGEFNPAIISLLKDWIKSKRSD